MDDCRESPALKIISELISRKYAVYAYDPKAMKNAENILGSKVTYCENMYEPIENADVLAILTEWEDFGKLDLKKVASLMRNKIIIDCRNMLDKENALAMDFNYQGIGK